MLADRFMGRTYLSLREMRKLCENGPAIVERDLQGVSQGTIRLRLTWKDIGVDGKEKTLLGGLSSLSSFSDVLRDAQRFNDQISHADSLHHNPLATPIGSEETLSIPKQSKEKGDILPRRTQSDGAIAPPKKHRKASKSDS